ncbi:nicotinamide mononucleotide transporter [bacterium]|nr:nicotinamide mononucleotide transporter [bacterium]
MDNIKPNNWKNFEKFALPMILLFVLINSLVKNDSLAATINALCGITYTFIAGKGNPICYLFGVIGSCFYCFLALKNALWGNLLLYSSYYIPMQIIGYFKWNKNLKDNKKDIVKIELPLKENLIILLIVSILVLIVMQLLILLKGSNPVLDSVTMVMSIAGMYLTVKRAAEQWIYWAVVNFLSLIMWINVLLSGAKVYSTVIMWGVYLILSFYFYINWKKEIKNHN